MTKNTVLWTPIHPAPDIHIATSEDPISLWQKHDYFHSERMLLELNTTRKLIFHGSLSCVV